jgi:hypothetical protein
VIEDWSPQPDRRRQHHNVRGFDQVAIEGWELVDLPALFTHVGVDTWWDHVVDQSHGVDADTDTLEYVPADRHQAVGVTDLRRALERAIEIDGAEVGVVDCARRDLGVDEGLD